MCSFDHNAKFSPRLVRENARAVPDPATARSTGVSVTPAGDSFGVNRKPALPFQRLTSPETEARLKSMVPDTRCKSRSALGWARLGSLTLPALAATMLLGLSAPASAGIGIDIRIAPPPPPAHLVVPRPRRGFVWAPGYWRWSGRRHVWVGGHWMRARRGFHWAAGHWVARRGRYHFVRGRWVRN
ncbi:MAG: YXWGXW repeat-containing protein [Steroidobacteraceae bacterium]